MAHDGSVLPLAAEGWTLTCEFEVSPAEQDDPSEARVRFVVENDPHEDLRPGEFRLFERTTQEYGWVVIVE